METHELSRFLRKALTRSRFLELSDYIALFGDPSMGIALCTALAAEWELMRSDFQSWYILLEEPEACKFVEWVNADRRGRR